MALNDTNKNAIAFKKVVGKGHTQQSFAFTEEKFSSNVQMSLTTIFGIEVNPNPASFGGLTSIGDTDGIVEKLRFTVEIIPDTLIGTNQSQGYRLKLPTPYTGVLSSLFSGGTYLHNALGRLQIVPSLYGQLKGDGTTEYDPVLYQTNGSTVITKFDSIDWILDGYNGLLFVQTPPAGFDVSASRPAFVDAFLYVGKYLDEVATGGTGSTTSSGQTKVVSITTSPQIMVPLTAKNDEYVASGTTGYTLYSMPTIGTVLTFTDALGTATTTPITINGNGRDINNDFYALVNTNYGSITITYNGISWNVTSFVT